MCRSSTSHISLILSRSASRTATGTATVSATAMARKNGPGLGPRLAPLAFLACALKLSFVGIHQSRNTLVPRRGEGFEGAPSPKVKSTISREQLERDHGDSWEMVDQILKGERASSPEAIMRARFTALRFKDPQFLAATEKEEGTSIKKRAAGWAKTLGLEEKTLADAFTGLFGSDIEALQDPLSFEVVTADEDSVEFKIRCRNGKTLHEKSKFQQDRKWGYVYSGNSDFAEWS
ncbi:unnamed protein product [Durusdinium trenchii]|uniref:YchJ-like middle NTF2-like domain-containing protein n=2 Tax=Durusdinium trenchii TaxID=1381693 RepID=A0ABP0M7S9_9DINO